MFPEMLLVVALLEREADLGAVPPLNWVELLELLVVHLDESEAGRGRLRLR